VADQYRTYFDRQLISKCNWYPLFHLILQAALINRLIINRDLSTNTQCTVKHFYFCFSIVHDVLQARSASTMKSSSHISALQKITLLAPATLSALPPLPTRLATNHMPLPLIQKVSGMHSPLWMESRVDCFLAGGEEVRVAVEKT